MKVIRAEAMGMCFGVRDALEIMDRVGDPSCATIHGELVHNEVVSRHLADKGFHSQAEHDRRMIPLTSQVVITAHGISQRDRKRLVDAGKSLIDTTCPLVERVHEAAMTLQREGYFVLVIGKPGHVEVEGIVGDLDRFEVVPDLAAVRTWNVGKLGVICQSTTTPQDASRISDAIRRANTDVEVRFIDTICRPTRERQDAMRALLEKVEAVVVVGGLNSNNTRQLARLAENHGKPALHVQSADDLNPEWCGQFEVIGLTGGTSTLDSTIDAVEKALHHLPTLVG